MINEIWKGLNRYFLKDAHQKSEGSVRSDLKKFDSFTLEMSINHFIRNFLRNGRLMVKIQILDFFGISVFFSILDLAGPYDSLKYSNFKIAPEVVFRRFQGEGVEFFKIGPH